MPFSELQTCLSDKQLAANRANAARSTGPRTVEGKTRSAQNARKHGFTASAYAVVRLEDVNAVANLKADLVAAYQPVNSQELLAIERIAIAQNTLLRAAALEAGLFTTCMNMALGGSPEPIDLLTPDLVGDLEVTRVQNRNVCLAAGFIQTTRRDEHTWQLFLRYQAQAERHYRRAIADFDRIRSQHGPTGNLVAGEPSTPQPTSNPPDFVPTNDDLPPASDPAPPEIPNEPIPDPDPPETEPLPDPETNPNPVPNNPIGFVPENSTTGVPAASCSRRTPRPTAGKTRPAPDPRRPRSFSRFSQRLGVSAVNHSPHHPLSPTFLKGIQRTRNC
jgi:hypothetical protein